MDGMKAHCMGMEFPKRDTDGPGYKWVFPKEFYEKRSRQIIDAAMERQRRFLPSAADLDAVADILRDAQNHLLRHYVGGEPLGTWLYESGDGQAFRILAAVAEEQRVKEKTGAQIPNR